MGCRTWNRPRASKRNLTIQKVKTAGKLSHYSYLQGQHESLYFFQIEFGFLFRFRIQFHSTFHLHSHWFQLLHHKNRLKKHVYLIRKHAPQNCVHIRVKVSMALVQLKPRVWIWRVHFCILTQVPNWRKGGDRAGHLRISCCLLGNEPDCPDQITVILNMSCCSPFFNQLCELSWRTLGP